MNISEIRDAVIIPLNAYISGAFPGAVVIEADQDGDMPKGPHATYKVTSPHIKDVGMAEETVEETAQGVYLKQAKSFKVVFSINAYAKDIDDSIDLATKLYDWFDFYGQEVFETHGLALVNLGEVENRDAFVVDGYERRNGFDVILRAHKTLQQDVEDAGYFDKVEINNKIYP